MSSASENSLIRRIIVIAPTRAACETIEIGIGLHLETYLETTHGERVRELARSGKGFGIIAGTGTGKTLAIRPIAEEILQSPLHTGVVNREREATPELPNLNVLVVTTGIARRWFQDGDITSRDVLVVDEIHQTSAELELCLALGKRAGCRFIWLSATVDPAFYRAYLNSADVLEVFSFDPKKAADVTVVNAEPGEFLGDRFLSQVAKQKRGVGVFLPTRAGVEKAADAVHERAPRITAAFYHGGEPIRIIRPFLEEDGAPKPYILAMTAAGQSALNVRGLDTVVIDDVRFSNVIERGRNVLTRGHLGSNEILQMAGRVHGRVENGRVFILSDRDIDFKNLRPTAPEFQLAGDSERVALTCAAMGVRADELDLPVRLDANGYRQAYALLQSRGIIGEAGKLTTYGKAVEVLPVERAWSELIVNADAELIPFLAVMSSLESLHRMTRDERDLSGLLVPGSDHLTSYNLYAEAYKRAGYMGEVYGLPRHFFRAPEIEEWAERRGVLVKSLEDAALSMASLYRSLNLPLPTKMPLADIQTADRFTELLARWMPFDLVIDERTADGGEAFVSKTSVCPRWSIVAGPLRFFADRNGGVRAAIEGTTLSHDQIRRNARRTPAILDYNSRRKNAPLVLAWQLEYHGFILEQGSAPLTTFPRELRDEARRALAESLARGEARHAAVHRNREKIEEIRELYRRSGGKTPRLNFAELTAFYEQKLTEQNIDSLQSFRDADLSLRLEDFVDAPTRKQLAALNSTVLIRGRTVEISYEIENETGVARLRLPAKLALSLKPEELPQLDRPLRFAAMRGKTTVRAAALEELQSVLRQPPERDETETPAAPQRPTSRTRNAPRLNRPPRGNAGRGGAGKRKRFR
jgi:HrpA-like RNA helicase